MTKSHEFVKTIKHVQGISHPVITLYTDQQITDLKRFCCEEVLGLDKKGERKVQGVPHSQTAALPRLQEEEETDKSKQAQTEQTYEKHSLFPKRGNRNTKRTEKGGGPGVSLTLCCFVVYSTRRFVVCLSVCHFVLVFFSPFSIAITSLGEERANLSAFRTFVRFVLV